MRRKSIFPVEILALLSFVLAVTDCTAEGIANEKGDLATGAKLENFTLPDLSGTEQSLDKLKGDSITKDCSGGLPFTVFYNEKGEITYLRQGKVKHETLKSEIEKTLGEKNEAKRKPFVNFNFACDFFMYRLCKKHTEYSR